jgi:hypothetical protein
MIPVKVGINKVTTFGGICNRHDTEVFHAIETEPFQATPQQLFLHHYRSVLFETYFRTQGYNRLEAGYENICKKG